MSITTNIENYAKWPNNKLIALSNTSEEFKDILKQVEEYRNSVSRIVNKSFSSIDEVINYVKNYNRENGEIRIKAHDIWIYSINIDQEDYYSLFLGHTRERQIEIKQRSFYSNNLWFEKQKEDAIKNFDLRKEEGKKYIDYKKQALWEDLVEKLTDHKHKIYHNHELDKIIEILKILYERNEDFVQVALDALLKDYYLVDPLTFMVVELITKFSSEGPAFAKGYLKLLKDNEETKDTTNRIEELIDYTEVINNFIDRGVQAEIIFNISDRVLYMPIIYDKGVKDIYLLEIEDGIYEGSLDGSLVTVVEGDTSYDVRIVAGFDTISFMVPKGNKTIRVEEHLNNLPTGNKVIVYFTKIKDFDRAIYQAISNQEAEKNIQPETIAKAYNLRVK